MQCVHLRWRSLSVNILTSNRTINKTKRDFSIFSTISAHLIHRLNWYYTLSLSLRFGLSLVYGLSKRLIHKVKLPTVFIHLLLNYLLFPTLTLNNTHKITKNQQELLRNSFINPIQMLYNFRNTKPENVGIAHKLKVSECYKWSTKCV